MHVLQAITQGLCKQYSWMTHNEKALDYRQVLALKEGCHQLNISEICQM